MTHYEAALTEVAHLTMDERLQLMTEIAATIPDEERLSLEWRTELDRRAAAIDSGAAVTRPWAEIRKELLAHSGRKDAS